MCPIHVYYMIVVLISWEMVDFHVTNNTMYSVYALRTSLKCNLDLENPDLASPFHVTFWLVKSRQDVTENGIYTAMDYSQWWQ